MVLHNFLHYSKSQPGSILLATTDEGLEQLAPNYLRNASPIVAHANFDCTLSFVQSHMDAAALRHHRFAGVQQQVVQGTLQLPGIKPSRTVALLANRDTDRVELRM